MYSSDKQRKQFKKNNLESINDQQYIFEQCN